MILKDLILLMPIAICSSSFDILSECFKRRLESGLRQMRGDKPKNVRY